MKIKILVLILLAAAVNSTNAQTTLLNADEFQKALSTPKVQLLDVRTSKEYQNAHLKNSFQADWNNPGEFQDRTKFLAKDKPVMVYCGSGIRSAAAAEWLRSNGYSNVQELKGGMLAWKAGNKPTEGISATKQMTMADYAMLLKTKDRVLVDFGAEWCPPCKAMDPILSELQQNFSSKFAIAKVDAGIHIDIMKQLKVDAIPTFIIYQNGKEVWRKQGFVEFSELKKQLDN